MRAGSTTDGELGPRLADATPVLIFHLVSITVALFLVTRLWILVAPRVGRILARQLPWLLLPLFVVVSVGHAKGSRAATDFFEGLSFTAWCVSLPLLLVWLASLAWRLARSLSGRGGKAAEIGTGREWKRILLATAPLAALIALVQWQLSREETTALMGRANSLRNSLRALEVTEAKAEEFVEERRLLAEKLDVLRRIVPREPATEAFVEGLRKLASAYDLEVSEWTSGRGPSGDVLHRQWVKVTLQGNVDRLAELIERTRKMSRLLLWRTASVESATAEALLWIYYAPDAPSAPRPGDFCRHPVSRVWLWPYSAKVGAGRGEVDVLCAEEARHEATRTRIDEYMAEKVRLEALVTAIEKVRSEWEAPEIEEEPPAGEAPRGKEA